ncbi:MAG: hypothetical protein HY711_03760, partial [Candidatus Melainabacteria bacterium]|nr:hypothetical protein [Candidatus Melainabacteria bacterium]
LQTRTGWNSLTPDLSINVAAGGLAGMVNAELSSLLAGKGHANFKDIQQSAWSFMVAGGTLGLLHRTTKPNESPLLAQRLQELSSRPDLRKVYWQEDGTRVFRYADESTISLLTDGTTVTRFDEGGLVQIRTAEGLVVEHYPNGTCYKKFPDGMELTFKGQVMTAELPNGGRQIFDPAENNFGRIISADGSKRELLLSGLDVTIAADGTRKTKFAGGETWVVTPDGNRTRHFQDGSSATRYSDGTVVDRKSFPVDKDWFGRESFGLEATVEPNGDRTIAFADGVTYTRLSDGRIIRREAMQKPQVWFPEAGRLPDSANITSVSRPDGSSLTKADHFVGEELPSGLSATEGIYPKSLWSKTVAFPDGEVTRLSFERGERQIEHPNGTTETTFNNGTKTIDHKNGDRVTIRPNGLVYESLADGLSMVRDGQGRLISWSNGIEQRTWDAQGNETYRSLREHLPDSQTTPLRFADPEGKAGYGVLYSDGTMVAVKPEHTTVFKPDGTRVTQYWDWTLRKHTPLGEKDPTAIEPRENELQMRIGRADGSETLEYKNGYKKTKYPDNTGLVEHTDGSKDIYFPDGQTISLGKGDSVNVTSYPSGEVSTRFVLGDRTISQYRSSGIRLTEMRDGTEIRQYPHGVTITSKPDSTQVYEYKHGEEARVTVLPGGSEIIVCRQGTYPAGTIITRKPDGLENIQLPQGFYRDSLP